MVPSTPEGQCAWWAFVTAAPESANDAVRRFRNRPNLATTKPSAIRVSPVRTHARSVRSAAKKTRGSDIFSFFPYLSMELQGYRFPGNWGLFYRTETRNPNLVYPFQLGAGLLQLGHGGSHGTRSRRSPFFYQKTEKSRSAQADSRSVPNIKYIN